MSVISQIITKDTPFTAPSDCIVSLRGKSGGSSSYVAINDAYIIYGFSSVFETKGVVMKKGDTITVDSTQLHVSGFTIDEG